MAFTFQCPHCGATLKTAVAVPAGKRVQCPKCKNAFVTGESDTPPPPPPPPAKPAPAPAAKPSTSSIKSNRPASVMDALNRKDDARSARARDEDDSADAETDAFSFGEEDEQPKQRRDEERARPRRAAVVDDEDDSEPDDIVADDDAPRRGKKGGKGKGKGKGKSGGNTGAIVAIVGAVIAIGAAVVAAVMLLGGGGGADSDMMAYLGPDSDVVVHVDVDSLMSQPELKSMVDQAKNTPDISQSLQMLSRAGLQLEDFSKVLVGASQAKNSTLVVVKLKKEVEQAKVAQAMNMQEATVGGKKVIKMPGNDGHIYMPSGNMMVISSGPENEMSMVMAREGGSSNISDGMKTLFKQSSGSTINIAAKLPPGALPQQAAVFGRPSGIYLGLDAGSSIGVNLGVQFDGGGDPATIASELNKMYSEQKEGLRALGLFMAPAKPLIEEVLDTLTISNTSEFVTAKLSLKVETIKGAANAAGGMGLPFGGGGMAPGGPGGFGPGPGGPGGPGRPGGPGNQGGFNKNPPPSNFDIPGKTENNTFVQKKLPPNLPPGNQPQLKGPQFMPVPGKKSGEPGMQEAPKTPFNPVPRPMVSPKGPAKTPPGTDGGDEPSDLDPTVNPFKKK